MGMKVGELMRSNLKTVAEDTALADALVTLADAHVSGLPVVGDRGELVGVVSTTDVLEAIAEATGAEERERIFRDTTVGDVMTSRPETIEPDADVLEAARRMLYLEIRRLFVELDGKLVGVISQTDIVGALAVGKV
jgi:CBS domain-containing protein